MPATHLHFASRRALHSGVLGMGRLPMQDKRAKALLEQPAFQDGEGLKEAAIAMLAHCSPSQEVAVVGEDQLQTCMLLVMQLCITTQCNLC